MLWRGVEGGSLQYIEVRRTRVKKREEENLSLIFFWDAGCNLLRFRGEENILCQGTLQCISVLITTEALMSEGGAGLGLCKCL